MSVVGKSHEMPPRTASELFVGACGIRPSQMDSNFSPLCNYQIRKLQVKYIFLCNLLSSK
jgi:hypothetical protein